MAEAEPEPSAAEARITTTDADPSTARLLLGIAFASGFLVFRGGGRGAPEVRSRSREPSELPRRPLDAEQLKKRTDLDYRDACRMAEHGTGTAALAVA